MNEIWAVIRRVRAGQLLQLVWLCLLHIRMIRPTYKATKMAIGLANDYFGASHRRNTPANAFRHALWNWLIAKECSEFTIDQERILLWTQKITDMHEKILPGNELSNTMDLHNNAVGRAVFRKENIRDREIGVRLFLDKVQTSLLVSTLEEIYRAPDTRLVHLIDPTP